MLEKIMKPFSEKNLNAPGILIPSAPTFYFQCKHDLSWQADILHGNCESILESTLEELATQQITFGQMIVPSDIPFICQRIEAACNTKQPYQLIYSFHTAKKNEKLLFEQGTGIYDEKGRLLALSGFISDITLYESTLFNQTPQFTLRDCIEEVTQQAYHLNLISNKNTRITVKELDAALYFCQGLSMKEIGIKLKVSPRTIESHLQSVKYKLGCHTSAQLKQVFLSTKSGKHWVVQRYHDTNRRRE